MVRFVLVLAGAFAAIGCADRDSSSSVSAQDRPAMNLAQNPQGLDLLVPPAVMATLSEAEIESIKAIDQRFRENIRPVVLNMDEMAADWLTVLATATGPAQLPEEQRGQFLEGEAASRDLRVEAIAEALDAMGTEGRKVLSKVSGERRMPVLKLALGQTLFESSPSMQAVVQQLELNVTPDIVRLVGNDMRLSAKRSSSAELFRATTFAISLHAEDAGDQLKGAYTGHGPALTESLSARLDLGLALLSEIEPHQRANVVLNPSFSHYIGLTPGFGSWSTIVLEGQGNSGANASNAAPPFDGSNGPGAPLGTAAPGQQAGPPVPVPPTP